jgi:hypothetical protein
LVGPSRSRNEQFDRGSGAKPPLPESYADRDGMGTNAVIEACSVLYC